VRYQRNQATEEMRKEKMEQKKQGRRMKALWRKFRILVLVLLLVCISIQCYRSIRVWYIKNNVRSVINATGESMEYPVSLIELLEKNPETEEFVLNYYKNIENPQEIDLSGEVKKGTIPLFLQWDERWGYEIYGSDFLAITGCGPTCLSMVYCGLTGDTAWDPLAVAKMAQEKGFYVSGAGSSWELMSEGAEKLGLVVKHVVYDKNCMLAALQEQIPIICVVGPGDFTTSGHYIVLTGVDEDGYVKLHDPNSKINSEKAWDMEQIIPQIRNLWGYGLE